MGVKSSKLIREYVRTKTLLEQWNLAQNEQTRACLVSSVPLTYENLLTASMQMSGASSLLSELLCLSCIILFLF